VEQVAVQHPLVFTHLVVAAVLVLLEQMRLMVNQDQEVQVRQIQLQVQV
jgi:hypothetical protein